MKQRLPRWLMVVLGVQLAIAVLFGLFGWSQTVSLAQGRPASAPDLSALAIPTVAVMALRAI